MNILELSEQEIVRRNSLNTMREMGIDPYPAAEYAVNAYSDDIRSFIERERTELAGDFCRGCGYCMPCPVGIKINNCARTSLLLRRAPSASWLSESWQAEMAKIEDCLHCNQCASKCPYELDTPALLQRNLEDYRRVLAGETLV